MQLIETIQISDGIPQNLYYHNLRFNRSRREVFGCCKPLNLQAAIRVPQTYAKGVVRCRVTYQEAVEKVAFSPYVHKAIRRLKTVAISKISYEHKWADRKNFARLLDEHPDADEVIMVINGFITDCTIANLAFWDGKKWFTPLQPLLHGTKRAQLLDAKKLTERAIHLSDLKHFKKVCLINAFRDLNKEIAVSCDFIIQ